MNSPTICWHQGHVKLIDQTLLPEKLKHIHCRDTKTLWDAIKRLSVRGAPAIGVAAGLGVVLGLKEFKGSTVTQLKKHVHKTADYLATSRPTAVNLFNVLDDMRAVTDAYSGDSVKDLKDVLKTRALEIYEDDRQVCRAMGKHGAKLISAGQTVMTICNAGALATVDYGTALGVFYSAKESGKTFKVFACETRPLLQGARLTAWELMRAKIDTTLICDSMAASVMKQGKIDAIFTGADRVASNGDSANKIGTYNLAVLAKHHNIPFYIVAPRSTFDMAIVNGDQIPIEERGREEIIQFGQRPTAPKDVKVYNPAFDVTESNLITGIVTEVGVIRRPYKTHIKRAMRL